MNKPSATMISLSRLSKQWPDGTQALKTVDLHIPKGQFCILLGPSGAGKSTLLRSMNGLVRPTQGSVSIEGVEMTAKNLTTLRRRIAMIHQHFNLSNRASVATNVLAGALPSVSLLRSLSGWFTSEQRSKACHYLAHVGLSPDHLKRRAGDLSGGQQQRVGIARAFMMDPAVVLADEPVASLDPKISRDILALLRDTARELGATVVCSLHQVDLAREFGDRIIGMRDGAMVFDGTPADFNDEKLHQLYHGAHWDEEEQAELTPELQLLGGAA
jgi:phosphonate transport system ATP-binding protein